MKTKELDTKSKHANKPLDFEDACLRYKEWAEVEAAKQGQILGGIPTPSSGLSILIGSTWHLRNVNGPMAKVGANWRVWRPSRQDT